MLHAPRLSRPGSIPAAARKIRALLFPEQDRLPAPIWVVFSVQVVNRLGDFVAPFITLLFTRKIGLPETTVGILVTATASAGMVGNLVAGKLCDHHGRKKILAGALFFVALLNGACGFIEPGMTTATILIGAGFFQGAVRPTISAILADLAPPDQRRQAWSLSYLGINIGAAFGPMLAGLLFERHLPWLFWGDALSTLAAIALILVFIPESIPDAAQIKKSLEGESTGPTLERAVQGSALRAFLARPVLVAFCVILLFINFIYGQTHFGMALYTQGIFGVAGARNYGLLMSCNGLTVLLCTNPLMRLTRSLPGLVNLALGSTLYALGFLAFAFPLPLPVLFVTTIVWTLGEILFVTVSGAWVAGHTPMNLRGRFQAIQNSITTLGFMLSPVLGGLMAEGTSVFALWGLVSALALLCSVAFLVLNNADRAQEKGGNGL